VRRISILLSMIESFKHRALKRLYSRDDASRIQPQHVGRVRRILYALDTAVILDDLSFPPWILHPLTGSYRGFYALTVRANWRIIFRFEDGHVFDVDYLDYH